MKHGGASRTALGAAGHRAAHQVFEGGRIFYDPLALRILGNDAEEALALAREQPQRRGLRFFIAARSRFAEDCAKAAISKSVRQILVLGAGLDTFAYRLQAAESSTVFELDHPATQRDKRRRLALAGVAEPKHVVYVAHDFEDGSMTGALEAAGLETGWRTFVLWLGVTPYLSEDAVYATFGELARFSGGAEVVFDYSNPPHAIEEAQTRGAHEALAARVAASGEPFRCYLDTPALHWHARDLGFVDIEDLDRAALVARYLPQAPVAPRAGPGGHVVKMATALPGGLRHRAHYHMLHWRRLVRRRTYQCFISQTSVRNGSYSIKLHRAGRMEPAFVQSNGAVKVANPRTFRAALLGAVAVAAVGGLTIEALPVASYPALAATTTPAAGPSSFADVVDRVKGAVVSVKVKLDDANVSLDGDTQPMPNFPKGSPLEKFFRQFGERGFGDRGGQDRPQPHMGMAQGSGFFISADGYVVTNNHVVEHAKDVTITTADGKTVPARVVGTDPKTDLALLKVKEGSDFPFVSFASETPRVGDWVIAVGNPFGLGGTVTAGIVSARGRDIGSGPYDDFLQIDAPVNHGNSGGPTFNANGEVVGVNTAIFSPSGGSVGIGFAIASDVAKSVVQSLKEDGKVARGWLGVQIQPVTQDIADSLSLKESKGALVDKAEKDSPAAAAGLKEGDVITSVNGETVADSHDLARRIAALGPKKQVELAIIRNGSPQTIKMTLGAMPDDKQAKAETSETHSKDAMAKYGMSLEPATAVDGAGKTGVVVAEVDPDGAAAQKGIQTGDVILEVAGKPVSNPSEVTAAIDSAKSDGKKSVLMRVKTEDNTHFVALSTQAVS
jgi:serine protease Do